MFCNVKSIYIRAKKTPLFHNVGNDIWYAEALKIKHEFHKNQIQDTFNPKSQPDLTLRAFYFKNKKLITK